MDNSPRKTEEVQTGSLLKLVPVPEISTVPEQLLELDLMVPEEGSMVPELDLVMPEMSKEASTKVPVPGFGFFSPQVAAAAEQLFQV